MPGLLASILDADADNALKISKEPAVMFLPAVLILQLRQFTPSN